MAEPKCPRGHVGGRVVRAGTYGPAGRKRQLWWCHPAADSGASKHRFSEAMPRMLLEAEGHVCHECSTTLETYEGPPHVRTYEFAARTIAATLVAVGNGVSYHRAARTARETAGWARQFQVRPRKGLGANGTMAGDWVGLFAPVVTGPVFDGERWPAVVALDELPLVGSRPRGKGRPPQSASWVIYGAYAHPEGQRGQLFRLHAADRISYETAAEFLRSIPGRPSIVVGDGGGVWPKTVAAAWPETADENGLLIAAPQFVRCQWHLSRNLESVLRASGILSPRDGEAFRYGHGRPGPGAAWQAPQQRKRTGYNWRARLNAESGREGELRFSELPAASADSHPLSRAVRRALGSQESWDELVDLAYQWQAHPLTEWLDENDRFRDEAGRPSPRSIGGLEANLRIVRDIVRDRAHLLNNSIRTQRMLDLVTLQIRGVADERTYARRIAVSLEQSGRAPQQRLGVVGASPLHS